MGSSAIQAIMAPSPEGRKPEGGSRNGAIIARMAREATL